ncbi:MAG: LysR substrate-binding domain-containing protein [Pseudomonadota bacterium]
MKMHNLRDLLAIAEKGSINAAAKHLGIAQPALSRSVRTLEREIGVALLERQNSGATLTPMGAQFARRAGVALHELRSAQEEVRQMEGAVSGTVTACVSSVSHIALLGEALRPFYLRYPNVQVRIIEGVYPVIEGRLKSGHMDFYVGPPPEGGPGADLHMLKLFDNARLVMGRIGHPLAGARSLAELAGADWISTSITTHAEEELSGHFLRQGLPPPRIAFHAESALSWITAAASTDMLVVSPVQWVDSPLTRQVLAPIPIDEVLAAPPIVLIHRGALPPTPAAEYLCDLMRRPAERIRAKNR